MTVCISVKVHDCLVFAADSATSLSGQTRAGPGIVKVFQHGNKVFNLFKGLPIVAMTCGMGNIGRASIATLAKDFRNELKGSDKNFILDTKNYSIGEVAKKARKFFFEREYQGWASRPQGPHSFEFWVGGYASNGDSEIWKVQIVNGSSPDPSLVRSANGCGINAAGQPDAFNRLVLGYGNQIGEALKAVGVDEKKIPQVLGVVQKHTQANLWYDSMSVQDAIRLADFLVETTKGFVSFIPGADIVGGDTDIAVVTKHEGFKWIRRKHYYHRDLNPLETDHV